MPAPVPVFARLMARVLKTEGCWIWTGAVDSRGYGKLGSGPRVVYAHRVMWEGRRGPVPPGMFVLHSCDNPSCVRLSHLRLGDQKENMRDFAKRGAHHNLIKTQCRNGHPYTTENTYYDPSGGRECRVCRRASVRKCKEARRAR